MKNYFIAGGSSGIGFRLVHLLAESGHKVFTTYLKNEPQQPSENISYHRLDVLEDDYNFDFLPEHLDGLVYCPGSINLKPFNRLKPESFTDDFQLQVIGAIKIIQALLPRLKKAENASVVLFSTVAVQHGFPFHAQVSVSKGAVEGLMRALAAELAPRIRVNCVAPSLTDTPLAGRLLNSSDKRETNAGRHPLKRIGEADDIANMAGFLLSDKAEWITGQVMHVDGGISAIKT